MELIWNEYGAERLFERRTVQVRVEGALPTPDANAVAEVITCGGRVFMIGAEASEGEIRLEGRIDVSVTAFDESGAPFGFESGASFRHTVSLPGALPGMRVRAIPSIQSISASPDGASAALEAAVDIDLRITAAAPLRVTGGVAGVNDLELKTLRMTHSRPRELARETLRLREEIAAEGVKDVISCEGFVTVRDAAYGDGAYTISGQVNVSAVTVGSDGRIAGLNKSVPFRESIRGAASEEPYCRAELKSIYLRSLGEDFGMVSLEAEVGFTVEETEEYSLTLPVDAFSPTIGFGCLNDRAVFTDSRGLRRSRVQLRDTVPLPDGMPEIAKPLFLSARPVVTEVVPEDGKLAVCGVLVTQLVYESGAGRVCRASADLPFEAEAEAAEGTSSVMAEAACSAEIKSASERSAEAEFTLAMTAECFREREVSALVGLAEKEREYAPRGLSVCFASAGEDVFDIAKRFSVPCAEVRKLNPDIAEPFCEGDKLIILS